MAKKSTAKHAEKHAAKHAEKHAEKHAAKHSIKKAAKKAAFKSVKHAEAVVKKHATKTAKRAEKMARKSKKLISEIGSENRMKHVITMADRLINLGELLKNPDTTVGQANAAAAAAGLDIKFGFT